MKEDKSLKYETKLENNAKRAVRFYKSGYHPFEACRKAGVSYNIGLKKIQEYRETMKDDGFMTPSKDFEGVKTSHDELVNTYVNQLSNVLLYIKSEKTTKDEKERLLKYANDLQGRIFQLI